VKNFQLFHLESMICFALSIAFHSGPLGLVGVFLIIISVIAYRSEKKDE